MSGSGEGRAVPYYCPFCASEDLWPAGETHGQWECRSCARTFAVRFVSVASPGEHSLRPAIETAAAGGAR